MRNLKTIAAILVLLAIGAAFAQHPAGYKVLAYDDSTQAPLARFGYSDNGQGYGVLFNPWPVDCHEYYVQICTVNVRLCPPPMDGYYQEKIVIYPEKNGQPDLSKPVLWQSDPFDVRVGYWWHTVPIPGGLWLKYPQKFYVFAIATSGYPYLFQWFDHVRNAPVNTQLYYNGSSFQYLTGLGYGDIMIDCIVQKHDFTCTAISLPWCNDCHYPDATIKNLTGFNEGSVPVRFWIKNNHGHIVYDRTVYQNFDGVHNTVDMVFPDAGVLSRGRYTAYCEPMFSAPGHSYPYGERNQYNDLKTRSFQISHDLGSVGSNPRKND